MLAGSLLAVTQLSAVAKSKEVILGEKAYSRGAYDTARQYFEQAIENGDETGDPRLYIGLILEARRQYAESIPYFRAAAERPMQRKFKKVAYWKLVILYRQAKLYPESLRYVERLEEMGEKSELFDKIRGEAEGYQGIAGGRDLKGYADIRKASALEKVFRERLAKGANLAEVSDPAQAAIAAYNQAISQDARWKEYRWKIAGIYEKLKQPEEAEAVYRLIWDESGDTSAAYKLGFIARRKGEYRKALKFFGAALEKPIEDPQLKFYIRYNAAQSHYALGNFKDSYAHSRLARRLSGDLELSKKTLLGLKRIYCLGKLSQKEIDEDYCQFSEREENPLFLNLLEMKKALATNQKEKAIRFATRIYEAEATDQEEGSAKLPAYCMSDLPVAIGVLFRGEKYRDVLELTDRFRKHLGDLPDYHGWRAVSHFALKEYGSASIEFGKLEKPTPSQMNLHLMAMAHIGDFAGVKAKGSEYLRNDEAREKLQNNLRKMRLYEPLRQEPDFEAWLNGGKAQPQVNDAKDEDSGLIE
ncbi:MAG: hypothetical protein OHK0011_02440 [Turneriella sp.]